MWVLNDRPSIRFVRDALTMRRSDTIDLVLSRGPVAEPVSSPPEPASGSGTSGEPAKGEALSPVDRNDLHLALSNDLHLALRNRAAGARCLAASAVACRRRPVFARLRACYDNWGAAGQAV